MAGIPIMDFLNETDTEKRNEMIAIAKTYQRLQERLDLNRATMIANAVIKGISGK
jgi:hypothetical protein